MQILFLILLFIFGACLGSFLCCEARRLYQKSIKHQLKSKRSVCLHCGYKLKWYDNIPIVSWLILKGKCRKCHKKIGIAELLSEFGVACAFLILGLGLQLNGITIDTLTAQPLTIWFELIMLILFVLSLSFLAIYDGLYGQLPVSILTISNICAIIILILREWGSLSVPKDLLNVLFSVLILGGIYLVFYLVSKGKWVGDGDWVLGTAIGIVLGHPFLSLCVLFLANFTACLVMAPSVKKNHRKKIYFGPFMVVAFVMVYSFGDFLCKVVGL